MSEHPEDALPEGFTEALLTRKEAAAYLASVGVRRTAAGEAPFDHVKVSTLAKWRQLGIGPPYSDSLGRDPRYHPDDLDEFLWGEGVARNAVEAKHRRRKRRAAGASPGPQGV